MADDNNTPSLAHLAARQSIRRAFITDFEARVESAGGVDAFLYTAPMSEVERMQERARLVIEDAYALAEEGAAAQIAEQRARDFEALLADEHATRDLVAEPALTQEGQLAYSVPDEIHVRVQENLARHLAFHETKVASAEYEHGQGFDHIEAASAFRSHLLVQQLDAYDRQLPVVESKETQFVLGSHLHERATRAVLEAQEAGTGEWNQWTVSQSLADHPEYLRDAIDQHRQFRADVALDSDEGVYPANLPAEMEAAWDTAAVEVDAGVDRAYGRERAPEHVAAVEETIEPVAAAGRLTPAQQQAIDQLTAAAARSYQGLGEPHVDDTRVAPTLVEYSAADDTPGTVYVHFTAAVTGTDDPEIAPVGDFRHQPGYVGVEPDGLLRAVSTRTDEAVLRAAQRNDRRLNVAPSADATLEQYQAELDGQHAGIRYEARSAKGIRDHFSLEDARLGGGLFRVTDAKRVVDLYTAEESFSALLPSSDTGLDPLAAEAEMPRWRAQSEILNDWHARAEKVGGEEELLATGSYDLLKEFVARIEQVGTEPAVAPDGQDESTRIRDLAERLPNVRQEELTRAQELERLAALTPAELRNEYMQHRIDWVDITPSLTDERLDELTAWIDEHSETLDGSLDQEYLDRHDELANHAYEEVFNRHARDRAQSASYDEAVAADRPFSQADDLLARLQPVLTPEDQALAVDQVDDALQQMANGGPVATPARDAYLNARVEIGAIGATLDTPDAKTALAMRGVQREALNSFSTYFRMAGNRPAFYRPKARRAFDAEFDNAVARNDAAVETANRFGFASMDEGGHLSPDEQAKVDHVQGLLVARDQLVARAAELQRNAVDEEIAREPEWLSETLGPRPEAVASSWQALAGELAANRLRFAVTDDADPGIRPEQTMLAAKVKAFQLELAPGLDRSTSDLGFGM